MSRIESLEAAAAGETAPSTAAQVAREAPENGASRAATHAQTPSAEAPVPTRFGLTDPWTAAFLAAEGFGFDAPPDAPPDASPDAPPAPPS